MADDTITIPECSRMSFNPSNSIEQDNVVEKLEESVLESPKCKRDFQSSQTDCVTEAADGETVPKKASFGCVQAWI